MTEELIEKLMAGVVAIGLHDDNETELFDITEADEAMSDAATLLAKAQRLADALEALINSFEKHRPKELWDEARAALAEWKP